MSMKKRAALLLAVLFLIPACGLAEGPMTWRYSFAAGEALSGGRMDGVREFLDAVQLELTTQQDSGGAMGQAALISYGKPVFYLRAELTETGNMGLYCSLTGECTLMCRRDQTNDFLKNIVRMLGDRSILKAESLEQAENLAGRAAEIVTRVTENAEMQDLSLGMNPEYYMNRIDSEVTASEETPLDGEDPECPGAAVRRIWHLSEQELNALLDALIQKVNRIPLISQEFRNGNLKIGEQTVTEPFLRELFGSMHGETTLTAYLDPEGRLLRLRLDIPDISGLVEDPEFGKIRGLQFDIARSADEARGTTESLTAFRLTGLEVSLLAVRMEKGPGNSIPPLPSKKVYRVGEMDSEELWKLVESLGLTIAGNMINLVMDLPRVVFDMVMDKLF